MWSAFTERLALLCSTKQQKRAQMRNDVTPVSTSPPTMPPAHVTADQVSEFLRLHPDFLERYVTEEVELEQLERWIIRRSQRLKKKTGSCSKNNRKTSLSRWKFCVHADKRQMLQDLTHSLQLNPQKDHVLWELANCISSAVGVDGFRLHIPDKNNGDQLCLYLGPEDKTEHDEIKIHKVKNGVTVPSYVARTLEPIHLSSDSLDPRFPGAISEENEAFHVLCQPIVQPDGHLAAVLELWRKSPGGPFHEEDEEITCSYLVWGGIALHYAHLYLTMDKQRKLNDFLLAVVKYASLIFFNMSINYLI
nr:cAMP and cAMP-inhibited cGMP 3',5'-cyclic phosphodiesterase 10A-like [Onthophagus taurus]